MATQQHIVSSYDKELEHLNETIMRMGGIAGSQLDQAMKSVLKRDSAMAKEVVESDYKVDDLEHEVATFTVRLLALRQPMAVDLRNIVAALKISSDIERIADYASNVAKRSIALSRFPEIKLVRTLPLMGRQVQQMFKDVLDAYAQRDAEKARRVWKSDEEVDEMYTSIFRELLTYMMEDPRSITVCTHLVFMAKNLERVGDHVTNIAENIHFFVHGKPMPENRPKFEESYYKVMKQAEQDAFPENAKKAKKKAKKAPRKKPAKE
ncbi:MAG: phosphate signaling complex protein PhoU [Alphaproteobacteria bacterium]|nr:phosphate signaling complex protein PhoU [Alphaproteobacteria bacterium]